MAYTPTALRAKNNLTFGSLVNEQNRVAMTGGFGNTLISQDATGTPVTSPQTNLAASVQTLIVPPNAVQFTVSSTVAIQVGEDSSGAQGINVPANTMWTFGCARMANIYIKPSNATNTVTFQFTVI